MGQNNLGTYLRTIKYLTLSQIYYRILYIIKKRFFNKKYYSKNIYKNDSIYWKNSFYKSKSFEEKNSFRFLNKGKKFPSVDWNFMAYGKLWNYNLVYFDFLNQKDMDLNEGLNLINSFIKNDLSHISGHEPYTISLRNVNWIKFIVINKIKDQDIDDYIYNSYYRLLDNLEFHLMGNHLLENGFSLLFGSYYFKNSNFYLRAKKIIVEQLEEQILNDGAHFELSPMYHNIILERLLDSIFLIHNNNTFDDKEFNNTLINKAEKMISWLKNIEYRNGELPHFNDSTNNIALSNNKLFDYANILKINDKKIPLKDSGYRKVNLDGYEFVLDVGPIGPDYIPGHGHADIFNFELKIDNLPIIVDTGTSTYENNSKRQNERSTFAHNTITINKKNQSEVWSAFRVGRRARVNILSDEKNRVYASHNGYKNIGITHFRSFEFFKQKIIIKDSLKGSQKNIAESHIHFHPDRSVIMISNNIIEIDKKIHLKFYGYKNIKIKDFKYSLGFNKNKTGKKIIADIKYESKIIIKLNEN